MVNYTLAAGTNAEEHFLVKSDTGDICVKATLDREETSFYELPVTATDRGLLKIILHI